MVMRQRIPGIAHVPVTSSSGRSTTSRPIGLGALAAIVSLAVVLLVAAPAVAQVVAVPSADLRLTGSVEERPQGGGITTGSEMRYRITIENRGPDPIPAASVSLVIFVDRDDSTETATIEVSRFSSGGLQNLPGNACGVGRHQILRCTNRQTIDPGGELSLVIAHRHPAPLSGRLSFFAEASSRNGEFVDPDGSRNGFEGPGYSFRNPPATTTTSMTTTTTTTNIAPTSTDGSSSSMTESTPTSEPSTTSPPTSSTTTVASSTTTTAPTTTTTAPTTTTAVATTTTLPTTSSIELMAGSGAILVPPAPSVGSVLDATGRGTDPDQLVALPTVTEDGGGDPPYLLIGGLLAALVLLSGVGLATYAQLRYRDPPLVDIRQYD